MSPSRSYGSHMNVKGPISAEPKPKMLKDFLIEDANSLSSSRFTSFPRFSGDSSKRGLIKTNFKSNMTSPIKAVNLVRNRYKAASALEAMVKVVKTIPWINSPNKAEELKAKTAKSKVDVKIKDIISWTSFRGMAEEEHQPLQLMPSSPVGYTTATTLSTLSSTSSHSSWCESDFSSDFSPSWCDNSQNINNNIEEKPVQSLCACKDSTANALLEKRARRSPWPIEIESKASVIDFEVGEDGEWRWSFKHSPSHMEIAGEHEEEDLQPYGAEEEIAMELLNQVKESNAKECSIGCIEEMLLVNFFRRALTQDHAIGYMELVKRAESWVRGECHAVYSWGIDGGKEAYIRDMDMGISWIKFEDDEDETVVEIESSVLSLLVDELLVDIGSN